MKIQIRDFETPLGFASVEINDGEVNGNLNEKGIGYFNVGELRTITYFYLGDRKETIEIDNPNLTEIEIIVRDLEYGAIPEYFVDRLVVAKRKKIIMNPNKPERKFRMKRSKTGKRHWK